jgi:regulator of sigma E protease
MTWLQSVAGIVIVFGVVVFVHELGHFLAAKLVGVYAPIFSIGFGPRLWAKRVGETEYRLSALPLGGYVRMASREDESMAAIEGGGEQPRAESKDYDPNALVPFGPNPVPSHRWFESKPLPARLLIMLAGVTMNVLLTLAVAVGTISYYGRPYRPAVVDTVLAGKPAAIAGLQGGDSITVIDGIRIRTWTDVIAGISRVTDTTLTVDVVRGGAPYRILIRPETASVPNPETGKLERVGRIGVAPRDTILRERMPLGEAVQAGWSSTWYMAGSVVRVLKGLATREVDSSNLSGPIGIARLSATAAKSGVEATLYLIALLSINLAVFNLLPIPILDGGQIVLNVVESIRGRALSPQVREYVLRFGLLLIGLLFVLVMYNDIKRELTGFFS